MATQNICTLCMLYPLKHTLLAFSLLTDFVTNVFSLSYADGMFLFDESLI